MELNKQACLPEELDRLDNGRLNELLRLELSRDTREIDDELVRQILTVLENREADSPYEENEAVRAACDRYREGCIEQGKRRKTARMKRCFLRTASMAAVVAVLLLAVPRASGENNFIAFITKITQEVIAFFSPDQSDNRMEYEYRTDHPGLQQVYDTMAGLGVRVPVVPSWLWEEYELKEIKTETFPSKTRVYARFEADGKTIVLTYEVYGVAATHEYHRDETPVEEYERAGIIHEIYVNKDKYLVFWKQENIDCFIIADCQEDSLIRILDSIYMMEAQ